MGVAKRPRQRSPKPSFGGSSPSTHASLSSALGDGDEENLVLIDKTTVDEVNPHGGRRAVAERQRTAPGWGLGWLAERLIAPGCKPGPFRYGGSNPSPPTFAAPIAAATLRGSGPYSRTVPQPEVVAYYCRERHGGCIARQGATFRQRKASGSARIVRSGRLEEGWVEVRVLTAPGIDDKPRPPRTRRTRSGLVSSGLPVSGRRL